MLHVTESRSWSGGTVQLWNLCVGLVRRGHAAALFCPPESEILRHVPGTKVDVTLCPMREDYDLPAAWRLAQALRRFKPHVVHAHHPRAHALALLAGLFTSVPDLVVSRRVSFRLKKWNLFSQWKYRSSKIRTFVAVSEDIRRVLIEGGVSPEKVTVIHSGVDLQRFAPRPAADELRRDLRLPSDRPVVGNLTHYSWWKGQTIFLDAIKILLDEGVSAHFLLAGKETDGAEAQKKVQALGIGTHVTLAGFRTDIPEVLSLLRVSVLSSLAGEGFSGVLREAMCMGVPVVATDVGGNSELVKDGKTGYLVPPGDARALARGIQKILADPAQAQNMALSARENVTAHYSLDNMVDKTIELYERIIAR
ncbi:MAG: glycosyltransferase family 4 protein [Elusimicrobia bacterium]|nr:glycosyltransferase family 4 protein [Elusimicrobiota bacterium]